MKRSNRRIDEKVKVENRRILCSRGSRQEALKLDLLEQFNKTKRRKITHENKVKALEEKVANHEPEQVESKIECAVELLDKMDMMKEEHAMAKK